MGMIAQHAKGTITGTAIATGDVLVTNATTKDTVTANFVFYNTHSSAVNVYLAVVADNGGEVATPAATDVIWSSAIPAVTSVGENWDVFDVSIPLRDTNDTIVAYAGTTAVINWIATYVTLADQS